MANFEFELTGCELNEEESSAAATVIVSFNVFLALQTDYM